MVADGVRIALFIISIFLILAGCFSIFMAQSSANKYGSSSAKGWNIAGIIMLILGVIGIIVAGWLSMQKPSV